MGIGCCPQNQLAQDHEHFTQSIVACKRLYEQMSDDELGRTLEQLGRNGDTSLSAPLCDAIQQELANRKKARGITELMKCSA